MSLLGKEENGVLKIAKGYPLLVDENIELAKRLDYITKEEIIAAIKKIAEHLDIEVSFTYDQMKKEF